MPGLEPPSTALAWAIRYAEHGWPVFPCNDLKRPYTTHGFKDATIEPSQISDWWNRWPTASIGVPTGTPSGLLIVDLDRGHQEGVDGIAAFDALAGLEHHGATLVASTPAGGRHLVYGAWDETVRSTSGKLAAGIDTRSEGGYAILPSGESSKREWIDGDPFSDCPKSPPPWLQDLLRQGCRNGPTGKLSGSPSTDDAETESDLKGLIRDGAPEGQRNASAARLAGHYYARGLADDEVLTLLSDWSKRCRPPLATHELHHVVQSIAQTDRRNHPNRNRRTRRQKVLIQKGLLPAVVEAAEDALLAADWCEPVYQRGSQLVRIVKSDDQSIPRRGVTMPAHVPTIVPIGPTFLRGVFEDAARFIVPAKGDGQERSVACPRDVVACYEQSQGQWRVPSLRTVVTAPTMRASGTVLQKPGYDPESKLVYDPAGISFPAIQQTPTNEDARSAVAELLQPMEHFKFTTPAARTVWLASVVTAVVRHLLPSAPMFVFDAPIRGSGKSKAAAIPGILATGRAPATLTFTDDSEEVRKRLMSLLLAGTAVINIDNIEVPLGGSALCTILTESTYSDRILGVSEMATVPTTATWLATGNNVAIAGDLTRRVLICRIDPQCESPEDRKFPFDPVHFATRRRPQLVAACLTLLRAHAIAGRPQCGIGPYGSFEAWSELVRAAIVWAGEPDPLICRQAIADQDGGTSAFAALLVQWHEQFGEQPLIAREVIAKGNAAMRSTIEGVVGCEVNSGNGSRLLGKALAQWRDRILGGLSVKQGPKASGGISRWAVTK